MATIGLSKPFFAIYTNEGATVTYSNGGVLGKYTQLDVSLNGGGSNVFYADNAPAESDDQFSGGTVTITTDDLRPAAMLSALGVISETITATGVTTEGAAWLVNNDNQQIPYIGLGGIAKKKVDGVVYYVAMVLDKVQLHNLSNSITTQGETITWQTSQLTGDVYRSDKATHDWRRISTFLSTEAEAEAAIKAYLNITGDVTPAGNGD